MGNHRRLAAIALCALATGLPSVTPSQAAAPVPGPDLPPVPPTPPAISDVIAVQADISFYSPPLKVGSIGSLSMSGSCLALVSTDTTIPEVLAAPTPGPPVLQPVCTTSTPTGNYRGNTCADATLGGTGSLTSTDTNLTTMAWTLDYFGSIGIFSGTATESDDGDAVALYGTVLVAAVPTPYPPGNDCITGIADMRMAGLITVVEAGTLP